MRNAINQNRSVQLALMGILVLAGGFLLLKATKGGPSPPAATSPATTATTGVTAAPTDPTAVPASTAVGTPTSTSAVSSAGAASVPASLVPGPGLPSGLLPAYHNGDAIVLLVRRAGGQDDALVRASVDRLTGLADVKVYVTKAQHIARYSWLTEGVDVTDLPALVVLLPRKLSKGTPTATVSYGFRDSASVVQAVKDALYRGPTRPYHP